MELTITNLPAHEQRMLVAVARDIRERKGPRQSSAHGRRPRPGHRARSTATPSSASLTQHIRVLRALRRGRLASSSSTSTTSSTWSTTLGPHCGGRAARADSPAAQSDRLRDTDVLAGGSARTSSPSSVHGAAAELAPRRSHASSSRSFTTQRPSRPRAGRSEGSRPRARRRRARGCGRSTGVELLAEAERRHADSPRNSGRGTSSSSRPPHADLPGGLDA